MLNDSRKTGDTDENKKNRPAPKPKDKKDVDPANFSQEDKQFYAQLVKFKEDPAQTVFDFPSTLDNKQRARVHDLAESLDLQHDSCGHGKRRYLSIRKKENNGLVVDGKFSGCNVNGTIYKSQTKSLPTGDKTTECWICSPLFHFHEFI